MSKRWMRVREAAAALSVSESTVRRHVAEGRLRGRTGRSGRQEVYVQVSPVQEEVNTAEHDGEAATKTDAAPVSIDAEPTHDELILRYERMAGGSLVLAQQRADDLSQAASAAYENLAHARSQLRHVRKLALAGWSTGLGALVFGFVLSLCFGMQSASSQARAKASEHAVDMAAKRIDVLNQRLTDVRTIKSPDGGMHALVDID